MASGGPPDTLNQRHFVAALMLATGYRQADIARTLGYHPNRLSTISQSPLFRAQVADLQQQLRDATLGDALAMIEREAPASVAVLVSLRDTAEGENVRRAAANDLLDRHPALSRRTAIDETRTVRIAFSAADIAQMQRALGPAAPPANGHAVLPEGEKALEARSAPRLISLADAEAAVLEEET